MASRTFEGTWKDLQESINRVRQQRGLVPRPRWDYLITRNVDLSSQPENLRISKRAFSSPFLPSLSDPSDAQSIHLGRGKKTMFPPLTERNSRKEKQNDRDPVLHKHDIMQLKVFHGTGREKEYGAFKHFSESKRFALNFVDSFISEVLQDDIVPDVLIETLTQSFTKHQKRPLLKSRSKTHFKDTQPDVLLPNSTVIIQQLSESITEELLPEVLMELAIDVIRSTMKDFVDRHLTKTATYEIMEDIVAEAVQAISSAVIQEVGQEFDSEEILDTIVSDTTEEEVTALVYSVTDECDVELLQLQKKQVTMNAVRQLIDMFFLEHLIDMIRMHGPVLFGKDPAIRILDSCMFDILLTQYLSIKEQQEATLENTPIAYFHQKAFEELALDVVLAELTRVMDEDMEDLLDYERKMELGEFHD